VEHVGQHLVVGVRMDRRHQAVHDADLLVQHLGAAARGSWWCTRRSR
jgi:subtilisin-like proprotein convertase family protein